MLLYTFKNWYILSALYRVYKVHYIGYNLYIYGKLVRSCWDGLPVVLTTLFVDRLTLSGFKSSTQFTSFHQYSDMLSSERMDVENNS